MVKFRGILCEIYEVSKGYKRVIGLFLVFDEMIFEFEVVIYGLGLRMINVISMGIL